MSIKSSLAGLGLVGAGLATLIFFRKEITDFVTAQVGAIGKEIRCGVDFLGVFEDCKQGNAPQVGEKVQLGTSPTGQPNICTFGGNDIYECQDALGKYTIKDPGTPNATIDGLTPSQYSLNVLQNIGSTKSSQWTPGAKEAYKALVLNLNQKDQSQLLAGGTGKDPSLFQSVGIFQIGNTYVPLTQTALDWYAKRGFVPRKVK